MNADPARADLAANAVRGQLALLQSDIANGQITLTEAVRLFMNLATAAEHAIARSRSPIRDLACDQIAAARQRIRCLDVDGAAHHIRLGLTYSRIGKIHTS